MDVHAAKAELGKLGVSDLRVFKDPGSAINYLVHLYNENATRLREAVRAIAGGADASQLNFSAYYPVLAVANSDKSEPDVAFGYCRQGPGLYLSTVTQPELFQSYLEKQLGLLVKHHGCPILVGQSSTKIPAGFAFGGERVPAGPEHAEFLERFKLEKLWAERKGGANHYPLLHHGALDVDYLLNHLYHHTGTEAAHFQRFVFFVNYQWYLDVLRELATDEFLAEHGFTELVLPRALVSPTPGEKGPQMPAYHLVRPDGNGITVVSIGVGASNARTIMDELSCLRPHGAVMLGHCAGLIGSQRKGNYLIASGYLREDHAVPEVPQGRPVVVNEELYQALKLGAQQVLHLDESGLKGRLQSGNVTSTLIRLWERIHELAQRYRENSMGVDMESAVVAACGSKDLIPTAALLSISDLPFKGEIKLRGASQRFYQEIARTHLMIGFEAWKELVKDPEDLHSRKLRTDAHPPVR